MCAVVLERSARASLGSRRRDLEGLQPDPVGCDTSCGHQIAFRHAGNVLQSQGVPELVRKNTRCKAPELHRQPLDRELRERQPVPEVDASDRCGPEVVKDVDVPRTGHASARRYRPEQDTGIERDETVSHGEEGRSSSGGLTNHGLQVPAYARRLPHQADADDELSDFARVEVGVQ